MTEVPDLEEHNGNEGALQHFERCLAGPPGSEENMMIEGTPGSGKTVLAWAYLRKRFRNPLFYNGDLEEHRRIHGTSPVKTPDDIRFFQKNVPGVPMVFIMIHGATDTRAAVEAKLNEVLYRIDEVSHTYIVLDESGEAFFRGLDEMFRPILTDPSITVIGTAQNFHGFRKADTKEETQERLAAYLRRFGTFLRTNNPSQEDLIRLLVHRMKKWQIKVDSSDTLRLLAFKSKGVVGYALRGLIQGITTPNRVLTRAIVEAFDVDPLTR